MGPDRLWARVSYRVGVSVARMKSGNFQEFQAVRNDPSVAKWFQGGRIHIVNQGEADALRGAGYGEFLMEVPDE